MKEKLTELKGDINNIWTLQCQFSKMDSTVNQKIIKEIEDLNNSVNNLDPIGIHGTLHPTAAEYA